jgi:hypothetical protein
MCDFMNINTGRVEQCMEKTKSAVRVEELSREVSTHSRVPESWEHESQA